MNLVRHAAVPVLRTDHLCVTYGGVRALVEVDLEVQPGQLLGLIGPNGAGKTTFIDAITGFTGYEGRVLFEGQDFSGLAPHVRARRGLARTWQASDLFDDLTVGENLAVTRGPSTLWQLFGAVVGRSDDGSAVVNQALEMLGLAAMRDRYPSELSQGQRKLVGVARALAASPRLLCLDEPGAGLDTAESRKLGRHLREMLGDRRAMLLIDHDMGLVLSVSDYVYVLDYGRVIAQGTPSEIRKDPVVVQAYLGSSASASGPDAATGGQGAAARGVP